MAFNKQIETQTESISIKVRTDIHAGGTGAAKVVPAHAPAPAHPVAHPAGK